ncbi:MAG: FAD-binding oxidoreductase, partial [Pseudomonadota bacterium]
MNPLYRNDPPGALPPSWYVASLPEEPPRAPLDGPARCDVAVLGAGFTGLWAALTLARAGRSVIVVDAHRVGFGASGRNGGQVISGFNQGQRALEARLGHGIAAALWDLSERGKTQLKAFCADHPETDFRPGHAHALYGARDVNDYAADADHMAKTYGFDFEVLSRAAFQDMVRTDAYAGGVFDPTGGHLHPLAYARALARA